MLFTFLKHIITNITFVGRTSNIDLNPLTYSITIIEPKKIHNEISKNIPKDTPLISIKKIPNKNNTEGFVWTLLDTSGNFQNIEGEEMNSCLIVTYYIVYLIYFQYPCLSYSEKHLEFMETLTFLHISSLLIAVISF